MVTWPRTHEFGNLADGPTQRHGLQELIPPLDLTTAPRADKLLKVSAPVIEVGLRDRQRVTRIACPRAIAATFLGLNARQPPASAGLSLGHCLLSLQHTAMAAFESVGTKNIFVGNGSKCCRCGHPLEPSRGRARRYAGDCKLDGGRVRRYHRKCGLVDQDARETYWHTGLLHQTCRRS